MCTLKALLDVPEFDSKVQIGNDQEKAHQKEIPTPKNRSGKN